jgi:serine/threonine protein phosphatase PrpC
MAEPNAFVGIAGLTHVGCVRARNEDSIFFTVDEHKGRALAVVADGMGGHAGGAVASGLAVDVFQHGWSAAAAVLPTNEWLSATAIAANNRVRLQADADQQLKGMGTTLVALLLQDGMAHVLHIGDSRCYLMRKGDLQQVTRDHSVVQAMIDEGSLTVAEAERSPMRHYLTRSLGSNIEPMFDLSAMSVRFGDRLLLCSDGLTNMLADGEIAALLGAQANDKDTCASLLDMALARGAKDNVSIIVCTI